MATVMQVESTQYCFWGITGTVPDTAEVAFLAADARPISGDWDDGIIITSPTDPLMADAKASGAKGTYFVARLVGAYNDNDVTLTAATYVSWLRLTGTDEQQVVIAPTALTVAG